MASLNPIVTGTSKRLEDLYTSKKKGNIAKPAQVNDREASAGTFDDKSLNYSSQVLKVDPKKRYS